MSDLFMLAGIDLVSDPPKAHDEPEPETEEVPDPRQCMLSLDEATATSMQI